MRSWVDDAVEEIIADLQRRKGIGNELDRMDADILDEIKYDMAQTIRRMVHSS